MAKKMGKGRTGTEATPRKAKSADRNLEGLETKFYKLERLCKWDRVEEVNDMLLRNVSPERVSQWCKERGMDISRPKLYEYKNILLEATAKEITVERILGIGAPADPHGLLKKMGISSSTKTLVRSEMEVLDLFIQRGFDVASTSPDIKITDAIKAIELKNKLTQGTHGGLTAYGVEQLREIEKYKFDAVMEVIKKYVPEDNWAELEEEVGKAERKYYEDNAPELLDEYDRVMQEALDELQVPDSEIVSDTEW